MPPQDAAGHRGQEEQGAGDVGPGLLPGHGEAAVQALLTQSQQFKGK